MTMMILISKPVFLYDIYIYHMIPYIFIINLEKRRDRRDHMTKLMSDMRVTDYEFVEPVIVENYNVTTNELSLILTVQNILKEAKKRSLDTCFIFEDDIMMNNSPDFVIEKIEKVLDNLPQEWDILYFEYCFESCDKIKKINDYLYKVSNPLCTASIIYNIKSVDKINSCIESQKKNLDSAYLQCHKNDEIQGYMVLPPLFYQDNKYDTDIQNKAILNLLSVVFEHDNGTKYVCRHDILFKIKWFNAVLLIIISCTIISVIIISSFKIWTYKAS